MMRIIRPAELMERLGISESTLHRWRKAGKFPEPKKLGPRSVGWPESEVQAWLDARPRASTGANRRFAPEGDGE